MGKQKNAHSECQILVDLFINYDCDFSAASIFERMVSTCVKIAQGKNQNIPLQSGLMSLASAAGFDSRAEAKSQEQRLRLRALCVLVAVVTSLVDWTRELAPDVRFFHSLAVTENKSPVPDGLMPVILNKRPLQGINLSSVCFILLVNRGTILIFDFIAGCRINGFESVTRVL